MVVKRSTALVESQTKAARIKQKIKDPEVRPNIDRTFSGTKGLIEQVLCNTAARGDIGIS